MERYLSFELSADDASRSDFAAYTLGNNGLLPNYFGSIAPINIFLGENNSGKSRFMRAIMKCDPTNLLDWFDDSKLVELVDKAFAIINETPTDEFYKIDALLYSRQDNNGKARNFLFIGEEEAKKESQISVKISPDKEIIKFNEILIVVLKSISSLKAQLNFVNSSYVDKIVKELQEVDFELQRARRVYSELWDKNTHGYVPNRLDRATLSYSSGHGSMTLYSIESEKIANHQGYAQTFGERMNKTLTPIIDLVSAIIGQLRQLNRPNPKTRKRTYIPTLRTARTLKDNKSNYEVPDLFSATIINDYELAKSNVIVHTGLALYNAIDEKRNSEIDDREEFERFEVFLSETFFNGKPVRVVPNRRKINILVAVDREERALPHLGDGIQAIILLLYPLFIAPKGAWFFIEEPETHLHPGFQRLFIKTVAAHPVLLQKKLTVFLTTHSNHLLDFAIDEAKNINLFTFRKTLGEAGKASYQVQLTVPHDLACLTALGVQNSSVFLSNCTIWVEGITDRIYLKAYLKAYLEHRRQTFSLLEGLHYSFLEYAGANVSHYAFGAGPQRVTVTDGALRDIQALSISNRIMLIADQDAGKETKHDRLTSQQHTGFEYVVLPTREIENLLTPEVIVAALKKLYPKQAGNFDAGQLKQGLYKSTYLARHLQGKFANLPASFMADSGTVASAKKRQFAEAAAEAITSWDMLSDEAKKLTEQVFKFIMGHNPRLGSN